MRQIAYLAVAALGVVLAASAQAQQRPMGATGSPGSTMSSGSSMSQPSSSMPAKSTAAQKSGSDSVKALQAALNAKGGANIKVDGKMGKETRDALKKYQQANGLKATGRSDAATRAKLGV
jgi:peptidoglycan hydrolase-like protein with peptidoglycan-binding domain